MWLYEPTPAPLMPDPMLNVDLAHGFDAYRSALLSCNDDKLAIGQWAAKAGSVIEAREPAPVAPPSNSPGLFERMRAFFFGG
jgi:hypothetical protein